MEAKMPLIPNEWLPVYYGFNVLVAAMLAFVIMLDRRTMRMSTPHAAFFHCIMAGLFLEGAVGLCGFQDERMFQMASNIRIAGIWALGVSIFIRTMADRFYPHKPTKGRVHA
jgi:hypothetical protein